VQVILSEGGAHFTTPMALQAVAGHPVRTTLLDPAEEAGMDHIALARWADLLLVAPASADSLARLAQGRADDLLGAVYLATAAPVRLAPAMNHRMWAHPATQRNAATLREDGAGLLGPAVGDQACGESGPGRMLEPEALVVHARRALSPRPLSGRRILVTAGPTHEPLDPVRYLGNRSSGKMGYALAQAAWELGAQVTLVSGPTALADPEGLETLRVTTAAEMAAAVRERLAGTDLLVAAAAVSDHRPAKTGEDKHKGKDPFQLALVANPDILAEAAATEPAPLTLGFAAETEQVLEHARAKRAEKGVDYLAANDVTEAGAGFGTDTNRVTLLGPDGEVALPSGTKLAVARELLTRIAAELG
jgi:phosphopantothenoylcysteine decarboxylase/phosphopantothenate--cysteine ligase